MVLPDRLIVSPLIALDAYSDVLLMLLLTTRMSVPEMPPATELSRTSRSVAVTPRKKRPNASIVLVQDSSVAGGISGTDIRVVNSNIRSTSEYASSAISGETINLSGSTISAHYRNTFGGTTVIRGGDISLSGSTANGGFNGPAISGAVVSLDRVEGRGNYGEH
ncbi:MAG: hypothetical protein AAF074_14800, partial [Pseudomonadota bacterium]